MKQLIWKKKHYYNIIFCPNSTLDSTRWTIFSTLNLRHRNYWIWRILRQNVYNLQNYSRTFLLSIFVRPSTRKLRLTARQRARNIHVLGYIFVDLSEENFQCKVTTYILYYRFLPSSRGFSGEGIVGATASPPPLAYII